MPTGQNPVDERPERKLAEPTSRQYKAYMVRKNRKRRNEEDAP